MLTFIAYHVIIDGYNYGKEEDMERRASEEQARVIGDLENNLILFASAGTGKTFTVANRIGNILRQDLAKPEEILCLTFTMALTPINPPITPRYSSFPTKTEVTSPRTRTGSPACT